MATAFFDESAVDSKSGPAFIFAGFVGAVEEWERASDAWSSSIHGTFHDKNSNLEERLVLAKVISSFDLQGFAVIVPHFKFADRNASAAKGQFGSRVYDWAFTGAVNGVLAWADRELPPGEHVDFVFDKRRELSLCRSFFDRSKREQADYWKRAGTCMQGDDEEIFALQMADLLAGEYLRITRTGESTKIHEVLTLNRSVLCFRIKPPDVLMRSLIAQDRGKTFFDMSKRLVSDFSKGKLDQKAFSDRLNEVKVASIEWDLYYKAFREAVKKFNGDGGVDEENQ